MGKRSDVTIILVPAARTEWDESGRVQGSADLPPAATGAEDARAVAAEAAALSPTAVLAAPDEASRSVAAVIAEAIDAKPRVVKELAEPTLGLWEGLERSACLDRYPTAFKQWLADPASVNVPDGEAFEDAVERIVGALGKYAEKSSRSPIAVVVRPIARRVLARWLRGEPIAADWSGDEPTEGVDAITVPRSALRAEPTLHAPATTGGGR